MTHLFVTTIRVLSVSLACFVLVSFALDLLGFVPYSNEMLPSVVRAVTFTPAILGSALFLVPYRRITTRATRLVLLCSLILVAASVLYLTVVGVREWTLGQKSWHILPLSLALSTLVMSNVYAFIRITSVSEVASR